MKRITLVIPSLTSGGAERVMTTLANGWAEGGKEVTLLSFDDGSEAPFYPLHPAVNHRSLALAGASTNQVSAVLNTLKRIRMLSSAVRQSRPEIVLSFLDTTNVTTLIATRGLGVPVVVEEHTDPAQKQLSQGWVRLRSFFYARADRVVVLSEQSRAYFSPDIQAKSVVIPNPIVVQPSPLTPSRTTTGKTLIALGRLGPEKGFDLLIDAFSRIATSFPDWNLVIWGEGTCRAELEAQIDRLDLKSSISLPGRTQSPHDELRNADLFVMSSRREGFPMALGEAMACGLPVISTDCPSGPRQIIRDGIDGMLVEPENPDALAIGLTHLMESDERRAALAAQAPEVLTRFGLKSVLAQWEALFSDLLHQKAAQQSRRIRTNGSAQTGTADGTGR